MKITSIEFVGVEPTAARISRATELDTNKQVVWTTNTIHIEFLNADGWHRYKIPADSEMILNRTAADLHAHLEGPADTTTALVGALEHYRRALQFLTD